MTLEEILARTTELVRLAKKRGGDTLVVSSLLMDVNHKIYCAIGGMSGEYRPMLEPFDPKQFPQIERLYA